MSIFRIQINPPSITLDLNELRARIDPDALLPNYYFNKIMDLCVQHQDELNKAFGWVDFEDQLCIIFYVRQNGRVIQEMCLADELNYVNYEEVLEEGKRFSYGFNVWNPEGELRRFSFDFTVYYNLSQLQFEAGNVNGRGMNFSYYIRKCYWWNNIHQRFILTYGTEDEVIPDDGSGEETQGRTLNDLGDRIEQYGLQDYCIELIGEDNYSYWIRNFEVSGLFRPEDNMTFGRLRFFFLEEGESIND